MVLTSNLKIGLGLFHLVSQTKYKDFIPSFVMKTDEKLRKRDRMIVTVIVFLIYISIIILGVTAK